MSTDATTIDVDVMITALRVVALDVSGPGGYNLVPGHYEVEAQVIGGEYHGETVTRRVQDAQSLPVLGSYERWTVTRHEWTELTVMLTTS